MALGPGDVLVLQGGLLVALLADATAAGSANAIRDVRFRSAPNAVVDRPPVIDGAKTTFYLRRTGPGAVTFRFTVADACGAWPTFVGGGPNAF